MKIEQAIKQNKKFHSNKEKIIVNLLYTYNWYNTIMVDFFKAYEITEQQYNVLRILRGQHPNAITCGAVKEVMLDKNPDLTRLIDRLVQKELVTRIFNESNRRQVLVKISKKGLLTLSKIDPEMIAQSDQINLTEKEAETLSNLLDKMRG